MEISWNESAQLYEKFKINLLEYEERYFSLLEDMVYHLYEDWEAEIMLWYIFARVDEDNKVVPLTYKVKDQEEEEVYLNNSNDLWDFLKKIEEANPETDTDTK